MQKQTDDDFASASSRVWRANSKKTYSGSFTKQSRNISSSPRATTSPCAYRAEKIPCLWQSCFKNTSVTATWISMSDISLWTRDMPKPTGKSSRKTLADYMSLSTYSKRTFSSPFTMWISRRVIFAREWEGGICIILPSSSDATRLPSGTIMTTLSKPYLWVCCTARRFRQWCRNCTVQISREWNLLDLFIW